MNRAYTGDCREVMRQLIADGVKVQTCVTSPPYWGLRDYGTAPLIWGGDDACAHEWGGGLRLHKGGPHGDGVMVKGGRSVIEAQASVKTIDAGKFCDKCGAWCGSLGLEPTPDQYVTNMVEVFRLVRDLLADDGTLWLNLGDSYYGGKGQNGSSKARATAEERGYTQSGGTVQMATRPSDMPIAGLKPKDLIGIPWRVAFALQADGWWLRQDIIWSKPNPMPESVTDRCTKAHEYIFLLSKRERYYYDAEAIKEPCTQDERRPTFRGGAYVNNSTFNNSEGGKSTVVGNVRTGGTKQRKPAGWDTGSGAHGTIHRDGRAQEVEYTETVSTTRNKRSVWTVATQPFNGSRFVDGADGDTGRIRSPDCQVHGDHCLPVSTARNGGQPAASRAARSQRTDARPAQSQQDGLFPIETHHAEDFSRGSSDLPDRACAAAATTSSTESRRTGRAPETSPRETADAELAASTDDSEPLPDSGANAGRTPESSTAPGCEAGELQKRPSAQTATSNADKCTCRIIDHFATFPPKLIEPCILAGSRPGDIVFDPFFGSGTVGQVCENLGRKWIGIDLNPDYQKLQKDRTAQAGFELA